MIQFFSRKNIVTMENDIVTKKFSEAKSKNMEKSNLMLLEEVGIFTPKIVGDNEQEIFLQYIEGKTYCELSDNLTEIQIKALVDYMNEFHLKTGKSRGDVNLRNFIFCEKCKKCVSVDFEEELPPLDKERDFGKILAFLATYNPMFEKNKVEAVRLFLREIMENADETKLRTEFENEIVQMEIRRKIQFDKIALRDFCDGTFD